MNEPANPVTFAQQTPMRIGAVRLSVRDRDRVAGFYRDAIGLAPMTSSGAATCLGAGGVTLLELVEDGTARPDDPGMAGLFHTAFLMPTRTDLARWLVHYGQRGEALEGASDHLVSEAIYLSDPEGNGIEVYADRPREAWQYPGGSLAMGTYRLDMADLLSAAADSPPYDGAPAGTRVGHIHLRVGDTDAAEAFYGALLGMDVTVRVPGATFLSSGGYHHHIGANSWRSRDAGQRDSARAGLARFEIQALPDEIDRARGRLTEAGVAHAAENGGLTVADPWGTSVLLTPVRDAS